MKPSGLNILPSTVNLVESNSCDICTNKRQIVVAKLPLYSSYIPWLLYALKVAKELLVKFSYFQTCA